MAVVLWLLISAARTARDDVDDHALFAWGIALSALLLLNLLQLAPRFALCGFLLLILRSARRALANQRLDSTAAIVGLDVLCAACCIAMSAAPGWVV
jgi:hypothetical protein